MWFEKCLYLTLISFLGKILQVHVGFLFLNSNQLLLSVRVAYNSGKDESNLSKLRRQMHIIINGIWQVSSSLIYKMKITTSIHSTAVRTKTKTRQDMYKIRNTLLIAHNMLLVVFTVLVLFSYSPPVSLLLCSFPSLPFFPTSSLLLWWWWLNDDNLRSTDYIPYIILYVFWCRQDTENFKTMFTA